MSPPDSQDHEHITHLQWKNVQTGKTGASTRQTIVEWIDNEVGRALVKPGPNQSIVGTVDPKNGRPKYLRTYADKKWNNNLLSLPTF